MPLSTLLDEAGVEPATRWVIAEGADAAAMSRSIPIAKAMDDALVCLYQNGSECGPRTAIQCGCCCLALRAT